MHRANFSPCAVTNLPTRPAPFDRQTTTGRTRPRISARPLRRRGDDADEPSNGTPVVRSVSDDDPSVHRHPRWGSTPHQHILVSTSTTRSPARGTDTGPPGRACQTVRGASQTTDNPAATRRTRRARRATGTWGAARGTDRHRGRRTRNRPTRITTRQNRGAGQSVAPPPGDELCHLGQRPPRLRPPPNPRGSPFPCCGSRRRCECRGPGPPTEQRG